MQAFYSVISEYSTEVPQKHCGLKTVGGPTSKTHPGGWELFITLFLNFSIFQTKKV